MKGTLECADCNPRVNTLVTCTTTAVQTSNDIFWKAVIIPTSVNYVDIFCLYFLNHS